VNDWKRPSENFFAHFVARIAYHPLSYDGPLTLIWSTGQEPEMGDPLRGDDSAGWSRQAPNTRVIPITGEHLAPIQERVSELAALLRNAFYDRAAVNAYSVIQR
jgi:hypothetical protein